MLLFLLFFLISFTAGYDQGVISVTLVMDQFLSRFPKVDDDATRNAAFYRGLMVCLAQCGLGDASNCSLVTFGRLRRRR
jgi:hypothetical protein